MNLEPTEFLRDPRIKFFSFFRGAIKGFNDYTSE